MHWYTVKYIEDGYAETDQIEACDPGGAFAHCQRKHPDATMIKACREGAINKSYGFTEYDPPKIQRSPQKEPSPSRALLPKEKGCEFPFYDSVKTK